MTKCLLYAYEKGIYNIRKLAVESMAERRNEKLYPFIEQAIDDNIMAVSLTAIEKLMQTELSDEQFVKIENRSEYWLEKSKNTARVGYRKKTKQ